MLIEHVWKMNNLLTCINIKYKSCLKIESSELKPLIKKNINLNINLNKIQKEMRRKTTKETERLRALDPRRCNKVKVNNVNNSNNSI